MAVSKRLRYEVLRRDNHACRYCGGAAPDVTLTVDHVVPIALGGRDEPSNLVTACAPCNSGKSATVPDGPLVRDVDETALRWSRAMAVVAERMLADLDKREQLYDEFDQVWSQWSYGGQRLAAPRPPNWQQSIDSFVAAGLPVPLLIEAVRLAMGNTKVALDDKWRYACGIAWRKVTELQHAAQQVAEAPGSELPVTHRPDVAFAARLLRENFEETTEALLREVLDEDAELAPDEAFLMAVERAVERLSDQHSHLVSVLGWVLHAIVPQRREQLARIARAEFEKYTEPGGFSQLDVDVRTIYLFTHPESRASAAAVTGVELGEV